MLKFVYVFWSSLIIGLGMRLIWAGFDFIIISLNNKRDITGWQDSHSDWVCYHMQCSCYWHSFHQLPTVHPSLQIQKPRLKGVTHLRNCKSTWIVQIHNLIHISLWYNTKIALTTIILHTWALFLKWFEQWFSMGSSFYQLNNLLLVSIDFKAVIWNMEVNSLLAGLKSTVEGLLSVPTANVWSIYGGLKRLTTCVENILNHGLKFPHQVSFQVPKDTACEPSIFSLWTWHVFYQSSGDCLSKLPSCKVFYWFI